MNDSVRLGIALGTGFTTGVIFFGGLWLTVRSMLASDQGSFPERLTPHWGPTLLVVSFWARQILTVAGVALVCRGSIAAWAAAMTGWLGAKLLVVGLVAGTEVAAWE